MSSHEDRASYWAGLFSEQKLSGLSVPEFCLDRGVSIHSYRGWRGRLNKESSSNRPWVTLKAQPEAVKASVIAVRVGVAVIDIASGFDPQLLREVVKALEPRC
jgi:hypothetical protein